MSLHTSNVFPVGLEEGIDGGVLAHSFTVPGCTAAGANRDAALDAFAGSLSSWLRFLGEHGAPVPPLDAELEIAVDEWVITESRVSAGESSAFFDADRASLAMGDIAAGLATLGDLRSQLLRRIRELSDADLDMIGPDEWTARRMAEELARAQWWTLSRLGSSSLAEVPSRTLGQLDTAMALVIQRFTEIDPSSEASPIELDGEIWTPRKVLRRLLWLEWTLGNKILRTLGPSPVVA